MTLINWRLWILTERTSYDFYKANISCNFKLSLDRIEINVYTWNWNFEYICSKKKIVCPKIIFLETKQAVSRIFVGLIKSRNFLELFKNYIKREIRATFKFFVKQFLRIKIFSSTFFQWYEYYQIKFRNDNSS